MVFELTEATYRLGREHPNLSNRGKYWLEVFRECFSHELFHQGGFSAAVVAKTTENSDQQRQELYIMQNGQVKMSGLVAIESTHGTNETIAAQQQTWYPVTFFITNEHITFFRLGPDYRSQWLATLDPTKHEDLQHIVTQLKVGLKWKLEESGLL